MGKPTASSIPETRLDPAVVHFTHLLEHVEKSELGLRSLRETAQKESALLHTYFSTSTSHIKSLADTLATTTDRSTRLTATEARREKWAEMEEMKKYQEQVNQIYENVREREETEKRLRVLLQQAGELLLRREVLGRSAAKGDILI